MSESQKIIADSIKVRQTIETDGWKIMAERLDKLVNDICDIRALQGFKPEERGPEMQRRLDAVSLVEAWLTMVKGDSEAAESMIVKKEREANMHILIKE
jgi:hypothetical protein